MAEIKSICVFVFGVDNADNSAISMVVENRSHVVCGILVASFLPAKKSTEYYIAVWVQQTSATMWYACAQFVLGPWRAWSR